MNNIHFIDGEKAEALLRDIATVLVSQGSRLPYIKPELNAQQMITIANNWNYTLSEIRRLFEEASSSNEEGEGNV